MRPTGRAAQGQIRKEESIRTASLAIVAVIALAGCGKPSAKENDHGANNAPSATNKPEDIAVAVGPAKNIRSGEVIDPKTKEKKLVPLWEIEWQSANLAMVDGQQSGTMFKVTGSSYEDGRVVSKFSGDRAEADRAANRLLIEGNVVVESLSDPVAKMTAKKVEWLPNLRVFKASGDVMIESNGAVVGPAKELYASPELHKVGTSKDYFPVTPAVGPNGDKPKK